MRAKKKQQTYTRSCDARRAESPMPPRKRIGLQQIMDGAQAPVPKTDAPASETDTNCEEIAVAAAGPAAPPEGEPARNASIKSPSRGTAGRSKYQENQARRKALKAEALAECVARGVNGAESVSMVWFQKMEAASLLTPSQKTLYNSLRANAQHGATADGTRDEVRRTSPRLTPLETIQRNVDTVNKRELESARAQLEGLNITAPPQGTVAPLRSNIQSGGSEERAQIKAELKEIRALLAADAARRKKKEAVVAKTAAAAAAPPPPKPAAEARVYQMPSFMSTSTW